jgi:hypothetical protein
MPFKVVLVRLRKLFASWIGAAQSTPSTDWAQTRAPLIDDDRVMQSPTHAWLRSIPNGVHPKQLCRHYPRIANHIAVTWHDVSAVDRLLTDLMVDRRGDRKGFPPRIRQEIDRLYRMHAKRMTPLLRGRVVANTPSFSQRPVADAQRRARLSTPMTVSSIKR